MNDPYAMDALAASTPARPAERRAARRSVAARADGAAELALLLDMLGLHPDDDAGPGPEDAPPVPGSGSGQGQSPAGG
ncbi:hypothetical protein [Streptomyces sp. NPDC051211]|uniref:hypothetical protein n=1 Tax=Streptomyces sp. NPDC051211 TaxID=3154643 RepID=UPI00344CC94D